MKPVAWKPSQPTLDEMNSADDTNWRNGDKVKDKYSMVCRKLTVMAATVFVVFGAEVFTHALP